MSVTLMTETNLYDDQAIKSVNDKIISQYGICQTSAGMASKIVTVDGSFSLYKNVRISVFFAYANTATAPTMNVNNTGAKAIWAYGAPLSVSGNSFNWVANSTIEFVYDGSHWLVADSGSVGLITKYDESLTQEVVFNKLTNNGEAQGIYLQNGKLYLNFEYAKGHALTLGGINNENGILSLRNASDEEVVRLDNTGIGIEKGSIFIPFVYGGKSTDGTTISADTPLRVQLTPAGSTITSATYIDATGTLHMEYDNSSQPRSTQLANGSLSLYGNYNGRAAGTAATISLYGAKKGSTSARDLSIFADEIIFWKSGESDTYFTHDKLYVKGSAIFDGTKSRGVETGDYGKRLLYCYETPSPLFGDVGEGVIADDGKCYVMIDSIFAKTVTLVQYQVLLQKYGKGDCWVSERTPAYFVVEGTPGLSFGWELKAKQSDFDQLRLEKDMPDIIKASDDYVVDYGGELLEHIKNIKEEREVV